MVDHQNNDGNIHDPLLWILAKTYGLYGITLRKNVAKQDWKCLLNFCWNFALNAAFLHHLIGNTIEAMTIQSRQNFQIKLYHPYLKLNNWIIFPALSVGYFWSYSIDMPLILKNLEHLTRLQDKKQTWSKAVLIVVVVIFVSTLAFFFSRRVWFQQLSFSPKISLVYTLTIYHVFHSYVAITWFFVIYHQILVLQALKAVTRRTCQCWIRPKNQKIFDSIKYIARTNEQIQTKFTMLWIIHLGCEISFHSNALVKLFIEGWQNRWHKTFEQILRGLVLWLSLFLLNQANLKQFDVIHSYLRLQQNQRIRFKTRSTKEKGLRSKCQSMKIYRDCFQMNIDHLLVLNFPTFLEIFFSMFGYVILIYQTR